MKKVFLSDSKEKAINDTLIVNNECRKNVNFVRRIDETQGVPKTPTNGAAKKKKQREPVNIVDNDTDNIVLRTCERLSPMKISQTTTSDKKKIMIMYKKQKENRENQLEPCSSSSSSSPSSLENVGTNKKKVKEKKNPANNLEKRKISQTLNHTSLEDLSKRCNVVQVSEGTLRRIPTNVTALSYTFK